MIYAGQVQFGTVSAWVVLFCSIFAVHIPIYRTGLVISGLFGSVPAAIFLVLRCSVLVLCDLLLFGQCLGALLV